MRRYLVVLLAAVLLLNCVKKDELEIDQEAPAESETPSAAVAAPVEEASKPMVTIEPSDQVIILVRADGAPGMYLGDDGEVHGFYVDLEKMIMAEMGQSYVFEAYTDVGPVVQGIKSGQYHIALSVPDLEDYRSFLNLSVHYETLNYVTFVRSDNTDITGSTTMEIISSLYGKRVGVQTQGHIYQILRDIKEIELVEYPTTTKAMEDLNNGNLDAVPDVKRIGIHYSGLNGWDLKPVGKAVVSHKISTGFSKIYDISLVERYNAALKGLLDDGSVQELWESYFGPMGEEDIP